MRLQERGCIIQLSVDTFLLGPGRMFLVQGVLGIFILIIVVMLDMLGRELLLVRLVRVGGRVR